MMRRYFRSGIILLCLLTGLLSQTAKAQQLGVNYLPRALCVTDPYGVSFHHWYGSPIAYNSYFSLSSNGSYSSGYNGATTGYFLGGVPAVASASTSEWTVQRTSVFPINSYYPAAQYPRPYPPNPGWMPGFGNKQTPTKSQPTDQLQPADLQSAAIEQAHDARPRFDTSRQLDTSIQSDQSIQPVSFAVALPLAEHSPDMAVGDRLFREGKYAEAYLCYLAAQRDIGQHSEIYLRQAFALVAMQKYSHAVAKLKRGFQVEPDAFDRIATFQEAFGADADHADFRAKKREWLEHVSQWAKADSRDRERQFLMAVLRRCDRQ